MGVTTENDLSKDEYQEEMKALQPENLKYLAEVAKHDLYVMCRGVLGQVDVNPLTHKAFCKFVEDDEPDKKRRMGLMPRIHLKTSIGTVGNNVRRAVKMPETYQGLIVGETETKAVNMLREIKNHWQLNDTLRMLYPDLVPEKFSGPGSDWAMTRATINRGVVLKEATWTALGKGGASVGGHWTHITADDIIGLDALESEAEMKAAKIFVDNIDSLLTNAITDLIDFYGTRWSRNDVYAYIMQIYGNNLAVFRREAIENGQPIFPQKHSLFTLGQIQRNPKVWFAQYCNNPMAAGQTDFPNDAVQTYWFDSQGKIVTKGLKKAWARDQLDIVLLCDPNGGSPTAPDDASVVVTGVSPDDDIFTLVTRSGKPSPSEYVDWIFDLYMKWEARIVGIEEAGQQNTLHYFEKKAKEEGLWPNVLPLKHRNREKKKRIRTAMEPILRSRRLYCLASQQVLRGQIAFFPDLEEFGELDALAYGAEEGMWQTPDSFEEQEEKGNTLDLVMARRSRLTGY